MPQRCSWNALDLIFKTLASSTCLHCKKQIIACCRTSQTVCNNFVVAFGSTKNARTIRKAVAQENFGETQKAITVGTRDTGPLFASMGDAIHLLIQRLFGLFGFAFLQKSVDHASVPVGTCTLQNRHIASKRIAWLFAQKDLQCASISQLPKSPHDIITRLGTLVEQSFKQCVILLNKNCVESITNLNSFGGGFAMVDNSNRNVRTLERILQCKLQFRGCPIVIEEEANDIPMAVMNGFLKRVASRPAAAHLGVHGQLRMLVEVFNHRKVSMAYGFFQQAAMICKTVPEPVGQVVRSVLGRLVN